MPPYLIVAQNTKKTRHFEANGYNTILSGNILYNLGKFLFIFKFSYLPLMGVSSEN